MLKIIKFGLLSLALISSSLWAATDPMDTLTSEQKTMLLKLDTTTHPSQDFLKKVVDSLTPEQLKLIANFSDNLTITPKLLGQFFDIAYDNSLSLDQRGKKLRDLAGITKPDQFIVRKVCIWDPIGRAGPIFQAATDQRARARSFGVDLQLVPYTDEKIATIDFKAKQCDAALISGLRARTLVRFSGTIDSIGGIITDKQMRTLLDVLSRPEMAKNMVQGPFVTLGIAQGGAAYVFVNDKSINSLNKAAGKKVAVLNYDKVQAEMVAQIGATPVPSTMISAPNKFNNGVVDVLAAPLVAYNAMELYKGMTPDGGIIDYPLAQITMQLIGWRDRIPNAIGQLIREAFYENYDKINDALNNEVKDIPDHWWINLPAEDQQEYDNLMQQARITLRDKDYYDAKMLTLERKIRCKYQPAKSECTNPVE